MKTEYGVELQEVAGTNERVGADLLTPLVLRETAKNQEMPSFAGVIVGELIGMTDNGGTPLVTFEGQPGTAAIAARSIVDLHSEHVGQPVALVFEGTNAGKPVVIGLLRGSKERRPEHKPATVHVDADGERLVVSAKEELVLQCGKARITLTHAGKVLIEGTYVSSRSTGVNRIKGGSVQLN